jgi:hypothetical protein
MNALDEGIALEQKDINPETHCNYISFLELVPVVLALYLWADEFTGKKVLFHIDNLALVSIMNKRS